MGLVKNIVYQYAGVPLPDELELDASGRLLFRKGDLLERCGKQWQIDSIEWELSDEGSKSMPTLWITLVNPRVN
jgi:hypothetical protein